MNQYYRLVGELLHRFFLLFGDWGFPLFAVAVKLVLLVLTNGYYKNISIGKALQPEIDKLTAKYRGDPPQRRKSVTQLLLKNGYKAMRPLLSFVLCAGIGLGVGGALRRPALYLSGHVPSLFSVGLDSVPLAVFQTGRLAEPAAAVCILLVLAAVCLQIYHDVLMQRLLVVDEKAVDYALWAALAVLCVTQPVGFALYWAVITALSFIQKELFTRFYTATLRDVKKSKKKRAGSYGKE